MFAITEGGETSSVIGTILTAASQYDKMEAEEAKKRLFFIFNNPETVLQGLDRSRAVLEDERITKIPLWTGPQAVTGSTRMQATTSETFLAGIIMEQAIYEYLKGHLTEPEMKRLGFDHGQVHDRLLSFLKVQQTCAGSVSELSKLTDAEADRYMILDDL